jgi:tetratricopeptide (TPR) repeat protein
MKRAFSPATIIALFALLMQCMGGLGADVSALIQQGDPYDQKFQPKEALGFYLAAEKLDPKNVDLLLRIARQYRHLSADETKPSEKMRLAELGKGYAERAVALAPNDAEAHLSVAISDVKMLGLLGTKEKLEASRRVKSRVDKVLALDPAKDLAWYVLGCWHQRLADVGMVKRAMAKLAYGSVPTATNDDAVKCFKKAIDLNPDRLIHYVELGRTYAQMGKKPEARQYIEKGLAMPNVGKDDPDIKQSGRETLSKIK